MAHFYGLSLHSSRPLSSIFGKRCQRYLCFESPRQCRFVYLSSVIQVSSMVVVLFCQKGPWTSRWKQWRIRFLLYLSQVHDLFLRPVSVYSLFSGSSLLLPDHSPLSCFKPQLLHAHGTGLLPFILVPTSLPLDLSSFTSSPHDSCHQWWPIVM